MKLRSNPAVETSGRQHTRVRENTQMPSSKTLSHNRSFFRTMLMAEFALACGLFIAGCSGGGVPPLPENQKDNRTICRPTQKFSDAEKTINYGAQQVKIGEWYRLSNGMEFAFHEYRQGNAQFQSEMVVKIKIQGTPTGRYPVRVPLVNGVTQPVYGTIFRVRDQGTCDDGTLDVTIQPEDALGTTQLRFQQLVNECRAEKPKENQKDCSAISPFAAIDDEKAHRTTHFTIFADPSIPDAYVAEFKKVAEQLYANVSEQYAHASLNGSYTIPIRLVVDTGTQPKPITYPNGLIYFPVVIYPELNIIRNVNNVVASLAHEITHVFNKYSLYLDDDCRDSKGMCPQSFVLNEMMNQTLAEMAAAPLLSPIPQMQNRTASINQPLAFNFFGRAGKVSFAGFASEGSGSHVLFKNMDNAVYHLAVGEVGIISGDPNSAQVVLMRVNSIDAAKNSVNYSLYTAVHSVNTSPDCQDDGYEIVRLYRLNAGYSLVSSPLPEEFRALYPYARSFSGAVDQSNQYAQLLCLFDTDADARRKKIRDFVIGQLMTLTKSPKVEVSVQELLAMFNDFFAAIPNVSLPDDHDKVVIDYPTLR